MQGNDALPMPPDLFHAGWTQELLQQTMPQAKASTLHVPMGTECSWLPLRSLSPAPGTDFPN